jgi:hypothetical protein
MEHEPDDAVPEAPQEPEKKPLAPTRIFTRQEKIRYFLIGFLGWWLINILLWRLLVPVPLSQLQGYRAGQGISENLICTVPIIFGMNVFLLIRMAFANRWIALGLLAAFAVNLVISLLLGLAGNAACWVPFTTPTE